MSEFQSFNWMRGVLDDTTMSQAHRLVLLRLLTHRYKDGQCNPGYDLLASEVGVHRATVIRAVEVGVERGWVFKRTSPGRTTNHYVLTFPNRRTGPTVEKAPTVAPVHSNRSTSARQPSQRQRGSSTNSKASSRNGKKNGQGERALGAIPPDLGTRATADNSEGSQSRNHTTGGRRKAAASKQSHRRQPDDADNGFDRFWSAYPKQEGRIGAEREFKRALQGGATADDIIAAATRYASDRERRARGIRFTKSPMNWLRDGNWGDQGKAGVIDQNGNPVAQREPNSEDDIEAMIESILATGFTINGNAHKKGGQS